MTEKNEEITKDYVYKFNGCPVINPLEEITNKLNQVNKNLEIIIEYLHGIEGRD